MGTSASPKDPKWREFEILVARIEGWLTPRGAQIKCPDSIPDKDTGKPRQIDATIRMTVGSAPILIAIECRDRIKTQDVTWIEQIAGKRDSIGADKMIAVSARGFTKPAREKADRLGIELRQVNEISEKDAAAWTKNVTISLRSLHFDLRKLELRLRGVESAGRGDGFRADIVEAFRANPLEAEIGVERKSGKPLTVLAIIDRARRDYKGFLAEVKPGGPTLRKTLTIGFPEGGFMVFTEKGDHDLAEMKITVDVRSELTKSAAPPTVIRYESASKSLLEVAQTQIEVEPGRTVTLQYSNTPPSDFSSDERS